MGYLWQQAGDFLMWLLTMFYDVTNSWGLSIIALTLLVRLAMHPLTQKQMVSMERMQKLQPRLKVLQDKYQDDKETLNKEVMALYKENKVNPAAGCLPMLIQLPIFILLYNVLRDASARQEFVDATFLTIRLGESFLSTIASAINLVDAAGQPVPTEQLRFLMVIFSASTNPALLFAHLGMWLPNTVLLLVIAFLTWYQQHLTSSGNPQMAMMGWLMPIFLTFICLSIQGGVLLYWGVSSLMSVVHQLRVVRKTNVAMQEKPVLLKEKPANKTDVTSISEFDKRVR
ncbi:MAG: YidC/Oxa1 family membrane protein insertase [Synergistaceae bacterium]|nr:YidC/Oxa1 family membrane protein insertase [Synergistaceae bacterium]